MRLPLATDLKTRTGVPDKDARLKNCYVESKGPMNDPNNPPQTAVRKRPVASGGLTIGPGIAQGGIGFTISGNYYAVVVNGDTPALIATNTNGIGAVAAYYAGLPRAYTINAQTVVSPVIETPNNTIFNVVASYTLITTGPNSGKYYLTPSITLPMAINDVLANSVGAFVITVRDIVGTDLVVDNNYGSPVQWATLIIAGSSGDAVLSSNHATLDLDSMIEGIRTDVNANAVNNVISITHNVVIATTTGSRTPYTGIVASIHGVLMNGNYSWLPGSSIGAATISTLIDKNQFVVTSTPTSYVPLGTKTSLTDVSWEPQFFINMP